LWSRDSCADNQPRSDSRLDVVISERRLGCTYKGSVRGQSGQLATLTFVEHFDCPAGNRLEVRDRDGRLAAAGIAGDLYVIGESIALGYWRRTDVHRNVFQGRWLRTGDSDLLDEDGYYRCLGRSDDLLKAGGI
jgi:acyl-CoA synthetase (AMP-forming)/AMP-acid ligase II